MIVLTTLAYGTVHYWALGVFALTAAGLVCLWCVDGMVLRSVQISLNSIAVATAGIDWAGPRAIAPTEICHRQCGTGVALVAQSLTRSVLDAFGVDPADCIVYLFPRSADLYRLAPPPAYARAHDHDLWFPAGDVWPDTIVHHRRYPRLLVSPVKSKHRFWPLHQSPPLRGLHGTRVGRAARSFVFGSDRVVQTTPLRIRGNVDGPLANHDQFTWRHHQPGR